MENIDNYPYTKKAIESFIEDLLQRVPNKALPKKKSITISDDVRNITVHLDFDIVASSIIYGRKEGKRPPIQPIRMWIEKHNIKPFPNRKGKLPTVQQLSYAIAYTIGLKGTKWWQAYRGNKARYYEDAITELERVHQPLIEEAFGLDWEEILNRQLTDFSI